MPGAEVPRYFNSHPHEEDDDPSVNRIRGRRNFNSHPHEEDDQDVPGGIVITPHFNSHPHEEDDIVFAYRPVVYIHFNSHPHEEDDAKETPEEKGKQKFQLTSSRRGWRDKAGTTESFVDISTHILTKRMTKN